MKKRSENEGANETISCGCPSIPGIAPRVAPRIVVSRIPQVVGCHSENGISYSENGISNSESCSENTPGTLPELREGPFHSESVFPEIGVVPRLLIFVFRQSRHLKHPNRLLSTQVGT